MSDSFVKTREEANKLVDEAEKNLGFTVKEDFKKGWIAGFLYAHRKDEKLARIKTLIGEYEDCCKDCKYLLNCYENCNASRRLEELRKELEE